jgi:hypothetical protein
MDARTAEALEKSIAHWREIADRGRELDCDDNYF